MNDLLQRLREAEGDHRRGEHRDIYYGDLIEEARKEIERLRVRLRIARNIIVDTQNFIHPTTVWRDTDLMQRNIGRFLADNPTAAPGVHCK